jgi:hypothetical protein
MGSTRRGWAPRASLVVAIAIHGGCGAPPTPPPEAPAPPTAAPAIDASPAPPPAPVAREIAAPPPPDDVVTVLRLASPDRDLPVIARILPRSVGPNVMGLVGRDPRELVALFLGPAFAEAVDLRQGVDVANTAPGERDPQFAGSMALVSLEQSRAALEREISFVARPDGSFGLEPRPGARLGAVARGGACEIRPAAGDARHRLVCASSKEMLRVYGPGPTSRARSRAGRRAPRSASSCRLPGGARSWPRPPRTRSRPPRRRRARRSATPSRTSSITTSRP